MFLFLMTLTFLNVLLTLNVVEAQPTVDMNFVIPPNVRTILIGEVPEIIMTARANGQDLEFSWDIDGPGEFKGDTGTSTTFYIPPDKIDGESTEATISVTVTDGSGKKATDKVTFTLLAPPTRTTPTPNPLPTPVLTPAPIRIRQVLLKERDSGDIIISTYLVEPGEVVTIAIAITTPPDRHIKVEGETIFGKVEFSQQEIIYTAPKKPGSGDIVTIKAVDNDSGEIIVQEIINITIRNQAQ